MKGIDILRKNIKVSIERLGWSQADLARRLKWTPSEVNDILRRHTPGLDKIDAIAGVLGVSISELLSSDQIPEPRVHRVPLADEIRSAVLEASLNTSLADWEVEALSVLRKMPNVLRDHHIKVMRESLKPYVSRHSSKKVDKTGTNN
jgi:transcriptional regulator with XRE-family HTH domain